MNCLAQCTCLEDMILGDCVQVTPPPPVKYGSNGLIDTVFTEAGNEILQQNLSVVVTLLCVTVLGMTVFIWKLVHLLRKCRQSNMSDEIRVDSDITFRRRAPLRPEREPRMQYIHVVLINKYISFA